jgi:hypothetical protein
MEPVLCSVGVGGMGVESGSRPLIHYAAHDGARNW